MTTIRINPDNAEDLGRQHEEDLKSFLAKQGPVHGPWPDEAELFVSKMDPAAFLAWAWWKRFTIITDELRRKERAEMAKIVNAAALPPELRPPDMTDGAILQGLDKGIAKRRHRVHAAGERDQNRLIGIFAKNWHVPGDATSNPQPLGLMKKEDLLAVAKSYRASAKTSMEYAKFFERLANRVPIGKTVADHLPLEQVQKMWDDLQAILLV